MALSRPEPGPFHANFDVPHSKLGRLFGGLLSSTLTSEWGAFTTSFEAACASTGPAERVALGVSDGHSCVVECRVNVGDAGRNITANTFLFV